MKKYDKYKKYPYDWLPTIPAHWEEKSLRNYLYLSDKRKGERNDLELLSVYREYGVIPKASRDDNKNVESENTSKYKIVQKNDLVINKMKLWQGSLGVSQYEGFVSPAYIVAHNIFNGNLRYLNFFLRSPLVKTYYNRISYGIRVGQWDSDFYSFKQLIIPVPPREEQDQIVRYLDWQVSNINKLIHGYQKQIDLLEERKRNFTFNAVTHGLQSDVAKIDSPLYWIESIPAHWNTNSIAQLFNEVKNLNKGMQENNLLSLSYGTIKRRNINATEGLLPASFEGYNIIEKDDIVLRLTDLQNDHKSLRTGIATERGIITSAYLTIRNKSENNPEYLQLFLHSFDLAKGFYNVGASGVRQSLNWDTTKTIKMLVPPICEQNKIVEAVKEQYELIRISTDSIKKQIELLREYRTRLISDVVTGQVDVRDIAIPDYTPEEDADIETDVETDTEEVTEDAE